MVKAGSIRAGVLAFVALAFIAGGIVYSSIDIPKQIERMEGINKKDDDGAKKDGNDIIPKECPDLLIQKGTKLYLYNTRQEEKEGVNPVIFNTLDEYTAYRTEADTCPILFLKQENNTQGKDVYRLVVPGTGAEGTPENPVQIMDASRDNGFNQNLYAGFDPHGMHVGQYTELDARHDSTENAERSDNPMDTNWGGVLFTQSAVDSGKYDERNVYPTAYSTPKGGRFIPIPGAMPPPPGNRSIPKISERTGRPHVVLDA